MKFNLFTFFLATVFLTGGAVAAQRDQARIMEQIWLYQPE